MKKLLFIGAIALFVVSCFAFVLGELYSAKLLDPPDLKARIFPAARVSAQPEKPSAEEARQLRIQQLAKREQLKLGTEFKTAEIRWHLEQNEAYCFFDITSPDIGEKLVKSIREGNRDAKTIWSELTTRVRTIQSGIQKEFYDDDLDVAVVMRVLDPQNTKETLLSAAHGVVGYDVVSHLDLKNMPAVSTRNTTQADNLVLPDAQDDGSDSATDASALALLNDVKENDMTAKVQRRRTDDVNIGDEWFYAYFVDGEYLSGQQFRFSLDESIILSAKITENDEYPDVGTAEIEHVITEDDLLNGFDEILEVSVTENKGRNSGKSAEFTLVFSFMPVA